MRLLIQLSKLNKAGKEGLIAVQKQVTKKGKTFTQTFYVKPETVPSAPTRPSHAVMNLSEPREKINIYRGGEPYEFESNRPEGGFFIRVGEKAVRVPLWLIEKVVECRGRTFVIHRVAITMDDDTYKWSGQYGFSELTTGLRVSESVDNPMEAEVAGKAKLDQYPNEKLASVIAEHPPIKNIENVELNTEGWEAQEPKKFITEEERQTFAKKLWETALEGEDGPFTFERVDSWLRDTEAVQTTNDLKELDDDILDYAILEEAIVEGISYEGAEDRVRAITGIMTLAKESDMSAVTEFDYETVSDWAREYEDNFVDGFDETDYGAYYKSGETAWTAADIVAYAIEGKMSLSTAQTAAEESTIEQEEGMREEMVEQADFTDSHGKDWDGESLTSVGSWIGGQVKSTREAAKRADEARRRGEEIPENNIVEAIEEHAVQYPKDETIYRGTGYRAWLEGTIGDVIPVGMASFSKSQQKALGFNSTVLLVIDGSLVDDDNPLMAVDIETLIVDGRDEGFSDAIVQSNVDAYEEEIEVIVRAPAFKIISREANIVYVKPIEMSLLEMMKALFENQSSSELIKEMERTFDYALHREPEDL